MIVAWLTKRVFTRLGHGLRQYSVIGALKIFYVYGFLSLPWNTGLGTVRDQKMNAGFGGPGGQSEGRNGSRGKISDSFSLSAEIYNFKTKQQQQWPRGGLQKKNLLL